MLLLGRYVYITASVNPSVPLGRRLRREGHLAHARLQAAGQRGDLGGHRHPQRQLRLGGRDRRKAGGKKRFFDALFYCSRDSWQPAWHCIIVSMQPNAEDLEYTNAKRFLDEEKISVPAI